MVDADLSRAGFSILGVDIGGTKIASAVVTFLAGQISCDDFTAGEKPRLSQAKSIATEASRGGRAVLESVADLVEDQIRLARKGGKILRGIAIASAGVVDAVNGKIVSATGTMPGWGGQPLGKYLAERFGLPVRVLNDVHGHAMGEVTYGAGNGAKTALVFAVGTGLGGAAVINGKILFGAHSVAGHFGHINHPYAAGLVCSCRREGHIESVASGSGAARLYAKRQAEAGVPGSSFARQAAASLTGIADLHESAYRTSPGEQRPVVVRGGRQLKELADAGDEFAKNVFVDGAFALGQVIGGLANSFDPDVIILSGSLIKVGDYWLAALKDGYRSQAMAGTTKTPIVEGNLGDKAAIIGAGVHFMRTIK